MFARQKPAFEHNSLLEHDEHQEMNTRVSEYLRKYGQGKIDELPKDSRPEVSDDRPDDEKLNDEFVDSLGTDELDVIAQLEAMRERYENAVADIKATEKQKQQFDDAVRVINDANSTPVQVREAYAVLNELESKGKITRART